MITIDSAFLTYSAPSLSTASAISISAVFVQFSTRQGVTKACVVLELLDLVQQLDGVAAASEGLSAVARETRTTFELINNARSKVQPTRANRRSGGSPESPFAVALSWPELTYSDGGQFLWGTHQPTADDWLKYCMLMHPAMAESLAASVAAIVEKQFTPFP